MTGTAVVVLVLRCGEVVVVGGGVVVVTGEALLEVTGLVVEALLEDDLDVVVGEIGVVDVTVTGVVAF